MSDPGPCVCWPGPAWAHPGHCCFSDDTPADCHDIEGQIAAAKAYRQF